MKKGGIGGAIFGIIWALVVIGGVLAVLQQVNVNDSEGAVAYIRDKSTYYFECIPAGDCGLPKLVEEISTPIDKEDVIVTLPNREDGFKLDEILLDNTTPGYEGPSAGLPFVNNAGLVNKEASLGMLSTLKTVLDTEDEEKDVGYSRSEWKHWIGTEGRPCWSTREEILYRNAVPGTVKLVNKSKMATTEYNEACAIGIPVVEEDGGIVIESEGSGVWIDPYSDEEFTNPSDLDIDHIIPLSNAARNGGQNWSAELKEEFANDPDNLLAVSASENRSKSDKGPAEYMPVRKSEYRCQYSKAYTTIAYKYGLTITESDLSVLEQNINSCQY